MNISSRHLLPRRQQGMALIVGLIMLMLMTLLAISAFHIGASQTVIVSNAQHETQGVAAAQMAIDTVINSSNFTTNPAAAIPTSNCDGGGANSLCVSSNNDGVIDFKVALTPAPYCVMAAAIPEGQLNIQNASSPDISCLSGTRQNQWAVVGSSTSNSLCATSTWEVTAVATDTTTGTSVTVVQGVGERILTAQMTSYCTPPAP